MDGGHHRLGRTVSRQEVDPILRQHPVLSGFCGQPVGPDNYRAGPPIVGAHHGIQDLPAGPIPHRHQLEHHRVGARRADELRRAGPPDVGRHGIARMAEFSAH